MFTIHPFVDGEEQEFPQTFTNLGSAQAAAMKYCIDETVEAVIIRFNETDFIDIEGETAREYIETFKRP